MDPKKLAVSRRSLMVGSLAATSFAGLGLQRFASPALAEADTGQTAPGECDHIEWTTRWLLSADQLTLANRELRAAGFRLVDLSGYDVKGRARYSGLWEKRNGPDWAVMFGQDTATFDRDLTQKMAEGYQPRRLVGYGVGGTVFFATIYEKRVDAATKPFRNLNSDEVGAKLQEWKGFPIVDISGYEIGGSARFALLVQTSPGNDTSGRVGLTGPQLSSSSVVPAGHRLAHVSPYAIGSTPFFAAIFERSDGSKPLFSATLTRAQLRAEQDERRYRGFRPLRLAGFDIPAGDRHATLWARDGISQVDEDKLKADVETSTSSYMKAADAPGFSMAVAKDGRLVYARGFGVTSVETNAPVTVHSRFRVGSTSKSITAVTVMKLIESGARFKLASGAMQQFTLDSKVFGDKGILGTTYGTKTYPAKVKRITVRHLLEHTAGGWGNEIPDGQKARWSLMFGKRYDGMDQATLLGFVLDVSGDQTIVDGQQISNPLYLANEPGTTFAYSGFGYFVLGRVIEHVTGHAYDDWVKTVVLGPASTMEVARYDPLPNEVVYHELVDGTKVRSEEAYSSWIDVPRADAGGGWTATAIDLVRFMAGVDGDPVRPDVFDVDETRQDMTVPSAASLNNPNNYRYGKGWILSQNDAPSEESLPRPNYFGPGAISPGSTALMYRKKVGDSVYCFAGIVNIRTGGSSLDEGGDAKSGRLEEIVTPVKSWPCHDLF